jgi:hypothetical protein
MPTALPDSAWAGDAAAVDRCTLCRSSFSVFTAWKHHCRSCGYAFCTPCSDYKFPMSSVDNAAEELQRVCRSCFAQLETAQLEGVKTARQDVRLRKAELAVDAARLEQDEASRRARLDAELGKLEGGWHLASELAGMGRRPQPQKTFYSARQADPPAAGGGGCEERLLTLTIPARRNLHMEAELCKLVSGIHHPFLLPAISAFIFADIEQGGSDPNAPPPVKLGVVRGLCTRGSLRDWLHGVRDPTQAIALKSPGVMELEAKPELLAVGQVALLGRQILEGVTFLQALGLPTGCLHAGNVVMLADTVRARPGRLSAFSVP